MPSRAQLQARIARAEKQLAERKRAAQYAQPFRLAPPPSIEDKRHILKTLIGAGWLLHRSSDERMMALKFQILSELQPDMSATDMMALYDSTKEEATHEPTEPTADPVAS